jgi:hypothetical protein
MVTGALRVQTYGDVPRRHVVHPEAKAAGPDGKPCGPHTTGELRRLQVRVMDVEHIGKESRDLEEVQAGLEMPEGTYMRYENPRAQWERDRPILRTAPRKHIAKLAGLHVRSIKTLLNTGRMPTAENLRVLHVIAEKLRRHRA